MTEFESIIGKELISLPNDSTEIVEAIEMDQDHNLFQQYPFQQVFETCSALTGVTVESFRKGVGTIIAAPSMNWTHVQQMTPEQVLTWIHTPGVYDHSFTNQFRKSCKVSSEMDKQFRQGIVATIGFLMEFTYWREYMQKYL